MPLLVDDVDDDAVDVDDAPFFPSMTALLCPYVFVCANAFLWRICFLIFESRKNAVRARTGNGHEKAPKLIVSAIFVA